MAAVLAWAKEHGYKQICHYELTEIKTSFITEKARADLMPKAERIKNPGQATGFDWQRPPWAEQRLQRLFQICHEGICDDRQQRVALWLEEKSFPFEVEGVYSIKEDLQIVCKKAVVKVDQKTHLSSWKHPYEDPKTHHKLERIEEQAMNDLAELMTAITNLFPGIPIQAVLRDVIYSSATLENAEKIIPILETFKKLPPQMDEYKDDLIYVLTTCCGVSLNDQQTTKATVEAPPEKIKNTVLIALKQATEKSLALVRDYRQMWEQLSAMLPEILRTFWNRPDLKPVLTNAGITLEKMTHAIEALEKTQWSFQMRFDLFAFWLRRMHIRGDNGQAMEEILKANLLDKLREILLSQDFQETPKPC